MKRGKRQVIEVQPEKEATNFHEQSEQSGINYFSQLSSNPLATNSQQKPYTNPQEMTVTPVSKIQPIQEQQKQSSPEIQEQKVDEAEEKRRKIELLKQKYLKKNKTEDAIKVDVKEEQISQNGKGSPLLSTQQNQQQQVSQSFSPEQQQQTKVSSSENLEIKKPVILNARSTTSEAMNNNLYYQQYQQNHQIQQEKVQEKVEEKVQETSKTKTEKEKIYEPEQEVTQEEEQVQNYLQNPLPPHHDVPKPPTKHHFKNPPPPPHMKKTPPPPINSQEIVQERQEVYEQPQYVNEDLNKEISQKPIAKTVPPPPPSPPILSSKPEILSTNSSKSEKQDNKSFAPPSTTTSTDKFEAVEEKRVSPPPPNRNMKDLLNKKLSSNKNIPRPPPQKGMQYQQESLLNVDENGIDPNSNWVNNNNNNNDTLQFNQIPAKSQRLKTVEIDDDEYNTQPFISNPQHLTSSSYHHQPSLSQIHPPPNAENYISEWLANPAMTLKELHPEMKEVIESYCLNKYPQLNIVSSNQSFCNNPFMKELVQSFLFNNVVALTEEQKAVAESVGLTYFYTDPQEFSDVFLILIVKLGQQYLIKYQQALDDQFDKYLQKILMYKNLLLPEEISHFVQFCIDYNMVNENNLLLFLIITGDNMKNQFLQFVSQLEIHSLRNNLSVLAYCQLNIKNKNILPLFMKTISSLEQQWVRHKMVEKILNHLKSVDIPENLYQYTKQLKLKLLKNYESNGSVGHEQPRYVNEMPNQTLTSQSEGNKDTGLFGLFNINKAIDKLKTQTEKALGAAVEKQKKPQEEEKKDEIVYDPIRKRYIINGEIPEDENEPSKEEATELKTKAPPPPPMGGRKPPPPMPGKKTGARIISNRYA